MNIKEFFSYMNLCKAKNIQPTWEGLVEYKKEGGNKNVK